MKYYVIVGGAENDVQEMATLEGVSINSIVKCKSRYFKDIFPAIGMTWCKTEGGLFKGIKIQYFSQRRFFGRYGCPEEFGLKKVGYTIFDDRDYEQMLRMNESMCGVSVFPSVGDHSVYIYTPKEI